MRDLTYRTVVRIFTVVFRLLGLRFRIRGSEHIPTRGAAVLACNHLSYLDFAFVGLTVRPSGRLIRFMAKQAVFDNAVSGPLMRAMGHIPVDRSSGAAAYRRATRKVQAGELVGVFPEATISRAWTLKPFKLGAATLAIKEQVPLVPVIVWGSQRLITVDRHYSLRRGKAITILVGEPLHAAAGSTAQTLSAQLRERMQALLDEAQHSYPDVPAGESDRWWLPQHLGGSAPSPAAAVALDQASLDRRAARAAAKRDR